MNKPLHILQPGPTANPNWMYATCPADLIPKCEDPTGRGEHMLRLVGLPIVTQGPEAGRPFGEIIAPWQAALIRYIFGTVDADGQRQVKRVFLKTGKGSGKTTLIAMLVIAVVMDLYARNAGTRGLIQIISATIATADVAFQHVVEAIKADPELARQFKTIVVKRQCVHVPSGITIEVAPSRLEATVGRRPIVLVIDEVHLCALECKQMAQVIDQARKGGSNWGREFLELQITTAPPETAAGVYSEALAYSRAVRSGAVIDPSSLPILFEWPHERTDLDITDPDQWWRGSPGAAPGGTMELQTLIEEFQAAKRSGIPRELALFLSQRLGVEPNQSKVGNLTPLQEAWADLPPPIDPGAAPEAIAVDPGGEDDPMALAFAWTEADGSIGVRVRQYLTRSGYIRAGDALRALFDRALTSGELVIAESSMALDDAVFDELAHWTNTLGADVVIGGDMHGRAGFVRSLTDRVGVPFVEVSQGWKLLRAARAADAYAADARLHPVRTELLSYNVENLTLEDGPRGRQFAKRDAGLSGNGQLKIDGVMALFNVLELILEHPRPAFNVSRFIG